MATHSQQGIRGVTVCRLVGCALIGVLGMSGLSLGQTELIFISATGSAAVTVNFLGDDGSPMNIGAGSPREIAR